MKLLLKNRAYSLNTKPNKKLPPKLKNPQTQHRTQTQQKLGTVVLVVSCSTACSEPCSAQLGAALRCLTHSASPQGFTWVWKVSDIDNMYQILMSVLFFQARPRVFWPDGRSAQLLCVRQHSERQTSSSAGAGGTGLTARTFLQDLFQILIRSCTRPWEAMVNINSYFTEN